MKAKISFDFDSTLSREHIQDFAYEIKNLCELWITTSRYEDSKAPNKEWNNDLYEVAESLGIPKERIVFTNLQDKFTFLSERGIRFDAHIDDDNIEVKSFKVNGQRAFCTYLDLFWKISVCKIIYKYL